MKVHENVVPCGYSVYFLLIWDNFCIDRKLNFKKCLFMNLLRRLFGYIQLSSREKIFPSTLGGHRNKQMLLIKGETDERQSTVLNNFGVQSEGMCQKRY